MEGYFPDVRVLYPKIEFPVSTGTPLLSHLVEWAHNETWYGTYKNVLPTFDLSILKYVSTYLFFFLLRFLPLYVSADRKAAAACKFVFSLHDNEHNYMRGHVIKGRHVLFLIQQNYSNFTSSSWRL